MEKAKNLKQLLVRTKQLIDFQRESEELKGERFNLFSILRMEHNERYAHSAFIAELLNPKGSHLQGGVFLKLFLKRIDTKLNFDIENTIVKVELHIISKVLEKNRGGYIDLFIEDIKGNAIAIENKIYAKDQPQQLERYFIYRNSNYELYYLNLDGSAPAKISCGPLVEGEDYKILSYQDEMIDWLHDCLKEASEAPILRESIKQYIVLLKKLTNTMDDKQEKQLIKIMLAHYEESEFIANNFLKVRDEFAERVRQAVFKKLESIYMNKLDVWEGSPANKKNSQVWVNYKLNPNQKVFFGIDGFSGRGDYFGGAVFAGVFTNGKDNIEFKEDRKNVSRWWADKMEMPTLDNYKINMGDPDTIKQFCFDHDKFEQLIKHIVGYSQQYIDSNEVALRDFLNKQTI